MSLSPQPWHGAPNIRSRDQRTAPAERRIDDLLNALEVALSAGAYPAPGVENAPTGLGTYLRALKHHKFLLGFCGIAFAVAGWFLSAREPKVYEAHTTLEILEPNRSIMNMQNFTAPGNSLLSQDVYIETQVNLLRSVSLVNRVRHV